MNSLELCMAVQVCLAVGVAGLLWPERLMPLFQVLMFPWTASSRCVRTNSLAAIGLSVMLFARLLVLVA